MALKRTIANNQVIVNLPTAYQEAGTRNSSLLINNYEDENGYLAIFTELDTHLMKGDRVFISSLSSVTTLDNYLTYFEKDNYPFTRYNMGYEVLNIDLEQNKVVLDILIVELEDSFNLIGSYLTKIRGEKVNVSNSEIDSVFFKEGIFKNNQYKQSIIIEGQVTGGTYLSKYNFDYQSLKRNEEEIIFNQNNDSYGYNYLGNRLALDETAYDLFLNITSATTSTNDNTVDSDPWHLYDNSSTNYWKSNGVTPQWVTWSFEKALTLIGLTVYCFSDDNIGNIGLPNDLDIQGWNGSNWNTITGFTNIWVGSGSANEQNFTLEFDNNITYSKYRLYIYTGYIGNSDTETNTELLFREVVPMVKEFPEIGGSFGKIFFAENLLDGNTGFSERNIPWEPNDSFFITGAGKDYWWGSNDNYTTTNRFEMMSDLGFAGETYDRYILTLSGYSDGTDMYVMFRDGSDNIASTDQTYTNFGQFESLDLTCLVNTDIYLILGGDSIDNNEVAYMYGLFLYQEKLEYQPLKLFDKDSSTELISINETSKEHTVEFDFHNQPQIITSFNYRINNKIFSSPFDIYSSFNPRGTVSIEGYNNGSWEIIESFSFDGSGLYKNNLSKVQALNRFRLRFVTNTTTLILSEVELLRKANQSAYNVEIENGNFYFCNLQGEENTIRGGYFENCIVDNYIIQGGFFLNCYIQSNCVWEGGTFKGFGSSFGPDTFYDGNWNSGTFFDKTWVSGNFNAGLFLNSQWLNGRFNGGTFSASTWADGFFDEGLFLDSMWSAGTFNSGTFNDSFWITGLFNDGDVDNSTIWSGGTFRNGRFNRSTWYNGDFWNGSFTNSVWLAGNFYGGNFNNSNWTGGTWYDGTFTNSNWLNGTWYNGTFENSFWEDGSWYNGNFNSSDWKYGTWYNGEWNNSSINKATPTSYINWKFGAFNGGYIDPDSEVNWSGGTWNLGEFVARDNTDIRIIFPNAEI